MLGRKFGPTEQEVRGEWRTLCNELHDLCPSINIKSGDWVKKKETGENVAHIERV
jgi:hypothetical protein